MQIFKVISSLKLASIVLACLATAASAQVSLRYMPANAQPVSNVVTPYVQLQNTDTRNALPVTGMTVCYYFYEQNLDLSKLVGRVDWCKIGTDYNAQSKVALTFAPYYGDTIGPKKANAVCMATFTGTASLPPGGLIEIHFAFYQNDWMHLFDQVDDYSWQPSAGFVSTSSVVAGLSTPSESYDVGTTPAPSPVVEDENGEMPAPVPEIASALYPKDCGAVTDMRFDKQILSNAGTNGRAQTSRSLILSTQSGLVLRYSHSTKPTATASYAPNGISLTQSLGMNLYSYSSLYGSGRVALYMKKRGTGLVDSTVISGQGITVGGSIAASGPLSAPIVQTGTLEADSANIAGLIRCKKLRVTNAGWADYVFAPEYDLMPLADISSYVKENGHLPGVPTAQTVADSGVDVADMQKILLLKVEELTLHMIALQQKNEELEKKVARRLRR